MKYCLGIDLGTSSIGWAIVDLEKNEPIRAGVTIFETSMQNDNDISRGKEETKNKLRREARMSRRLKKRRVMRLMHLFNVLRDNNLLPVDIAVGRDDPQARAEVIHNVDIRMRQALGIILHKDEQVVSYIYRAMALDEKLEPHFIGAVLYHLAKKRGFESNRKSDKNEKELGVVKTGITELEKLIIESNSRTLGEYFSKIDAEKERIRQRWTGRKMYKDEFNMIWDKQSLYYPEILTIDLKKEIEEAIFYQRPLKSMKRAVGYCTFEKYSKRSHVAMPCFQEFRMLQTINNLKFKTQNGMEQSLDDEMRSSLIMEFMKHKELSFKTLKKAICIPEDSYFNFEKPGVDKLKCGNSTAYEMKKVFGDSWFDFNDSMKRSIVNDILEIESEEELIKKGVDKWELDREKSTGLLTVKLENGYASLSEKAIEKFLPSMRKGLTYAEACKQIYGDRVNKPLDFLPPLDSKILSNEFKHITNPIVKKVITELRKVINAIIKQYGKPERIIIELARDLKKGKGEREDIFNNNIKRNKQREESIKSIIRECGVSNPSSADIDKWLFFEECAGKCPYTFNVISPSELFAGEKWQVEHIIPFSRSLDNSFNNKTVCLTSENAKKGNRTPFEAYGGTEIWEQMVSNAKKIWGGKNRRKLELFLSEKTDFLEGFSTRQLNDTRYASKLAMGYLGLLYGGIDDIAGKKRIYASQGTVTAHIRKAWNLNSLLNDGPGKNREDHRHHAVDAIAIAYTGPGVIKQLSVAASRVKKNTGRAVFDKMDEPCTEFINKCREIIESVIVVHKVSKKYKGKMHEDTHYSRRIIASDGNEYVHIRKKLEGGVAGKGDAAKKWIEKIVDKRIAGIVKTHLDLNDWDPKKAFAETNLPYSETKDGRKIFIKKVRIKVSDNPIKVGSGHRYVLTGSNHHVEIYETVNKKGENVWQGDVISTFEAVKRLERHKKDGSSVIQINKSKGKFITSLAIGETFGIREDGKEKLYRVDGITINKEGLVSVKYRSIFNAGKAEYGVTQFSKTVNALKEVFISKYTLTQLGELRRAND